MPKTAKFVAVYGTLKQGKRLHGALNRAPLSTERLNGFEMRSIGWFPGIFPNQDESIEVEVYELTNNSELEHLDAIEGVPHLYTREVVTSSFGDTFIYVKTGDPNEYELIEGGRFE